MFKPLLTMALVITASSLLAACTRSASDVQQDQAAPNQANPAEIIQEGKVEITEPSPVVEGTSPIEVLEVTMDTGEFFFSPKVISAKPGQTVNITLTNSGGMMPHDFVIDELNVASEEIMKGEETTVSFTVPASAAGKEYEFYCSIGEHRANGMVGTLTITE